MFYYLIIGITLFVLILIVISLRPLRIKASVEPNPIFRYDIAIDRINEMLEAEKQIPDLNPKCKSRLFSHGEKTKKAIVFLHGFTSCPEQFVKLGGEFFERGYNVFIPRLPKHGFMDRKGSALKTLTAQELANFGTDIVDIAQGLGDHVTVSGLSGGGSLLTWLAQERTDIEIAVPISPFLGISFIPARLTRLATKLLLTMPDFFMWWDPATKLHNPFSSDFQYLGHHTHALAGFLSLSIAAMDKLRTKPPAAESLILISNASDNSINMEMVSEYLQLLMQQTNYRVETYQFPAELEQPHDIITPGRRDNNVDLIYPKLIDLLSKE